jgi:hypothetical protein
VGVAVAAAAGVGVVAGGPGSGGAAGCAGVGVAGSDGTPCVGTGVAPPSGGVTAGVEVAARGVGVLRLATVGDGLDVARVAVGRAGDAPVVAVGWPTAGTVATTTGGRGTGTYSVGVGMSVGVGLVATRGVGEAIWPPSAPAIVGDAVGNASGVSCGCTVAVAVVERAARALACRRGAATSEARASR